MRKLLLLCLLLLGMQVTVGAQDNATEPERPRPQQGRGGFGGLSNWGLMTSKRMKIHQPTS